MAVYFLRIRYPLSLPLILMTSIHWIRVKEGGKIDSERKLRISKKGQRDMHK